MTLFLRFIATLALVAIAICCFLTGKIFYDFTQSTCFGSCSSGSLLPVTKITLGGAGPVSNYLDGKLTYQPYTYPSTLPDTNIHNNFEVLDQDFKVQKVSFLKVSESGTYIDGMLLEIIVMDFAGNTVRTISATQLDLKNAALGSWIDIPIVATGSTEVFIGEQLMAHVWRTGAAGGSYISNVHLSADIQLQ